MLTRFVFVFLVLVAGLETVWALENIDTNPFGYVDPQICADCHVEQATGFKQVGMSKSFRKASSDWLTEEKRQSLPFFHEASQRYYNFDVREGSLLFLRYQLDSNDVKVNQIEIEVDYFLGSGNKVVSPLYRTVNNEIYALPINWYSEDGFWEMAPGYEQKHHYGLSRKVQRECLFCHNAYPLEGMGNDSYLHSDSFPQQLPEGIDCQRCHGPGGEHVNALLSGDAGIDVIRNAIVNPSKLPVEERDSVCFQCHMLPSVSMAGVRRFNRSDYSFRPGQKLSDYLIHVEPVDSSISKEQRFEINHHAYRLVASACFTKSEGALTCITCHDPHSKPAQNDFLNKVDTTCTSCHGQAHKVKDQRDQTWDNCVSCHMPQRRAQDVIHAVMTDHRIGIFNKNKELLDPLEKKEPDITGLDFLENNLEFHALEGDIYRLVAILRAVPSANYAHYLKSRLQQSRYPQLIPYMVLAETQMQLKQFDEASKTIQYIEQKFGSNSRLTELSALIKLSQDDLSESERIFNWLIEQDVQDAKLLFNYGLLKYRKQDYNNAFELFGGALALKENFANAAMYQGMSKLKLGEVNAAIQFFRLSLQIEPALDRSYLQLINIYHDMHNTEEARRLFRLGLRNAIDPESIALLAQQESKAYLTQSGSGD